MPETKANHKYEAKDQGYIELPLISQCSGDFDSSIEIALIERRVRAILANPLVDTPISYSNMESILKLTELFYSGHPAVLAYLHEEFSQVARLILEIPGVESVFGLGYPFYAIRSDGRSFIIDEIKRFVGSTIDKVQEDSLRQPTGEWPCVSCIEEHPAVDLTSNCSPCGRTKIKPRDIFKALPDLDIAIITKNPGPQTEKSVQNLLSEHGYFQSDTKIGRAIHQSGNVFDAIIQGSYPNDHLPVDAHIWSLGEYLEKVDQITQGSTHIEIGDRALHVDWVDSKLNLFFDFGFSLTLLAGTREFVSQDSKHRELFKRAWPANRFNKLVESLASCSARAERLLSEPSIRRVLAYRWEDWNDDSA